MQRQPGARRRAPRGSARRRRREPADARRREVDVRDDERPVRDASSDDVRERLVGRHGTPSRGRARRRRAAARASAPPSARPAAATSSSALPGATSSARSKPPRSARAGRAGGRARAARCATFAAPVAVQVDAHAGPRLVCALDRRHRREAIALDASRSADDALDARAERAQALVDALVAAVDLADVRRSSTCPRRRGSRSASPCRRGCPGSTCAAPYSRAGPVTTARCGSQRMIRAPIDDELVDEEQAVLEHLLEDQDRPPRLRRDRERDRREVGRERGPRPVLDLRDLAAEVVPDRRAPGPAARARCVPPISTWTPSRANAGRIETRSCGLASSIVMSPPVTAARPMKLATSMCSGAIRYSPPPSRSTPSMRSTFELDALDPRAERDEEAAEVLDVRLAGGVPDHRLARRRATAAMTAFSVAITLASSRKTCVPRQAVGAHLVARRRSCDLGAELARSAWMCGSSRRRPITSPPGGGTHRAAEAREQRAGEQERRADARGRAPRRARSCRSSRRVDAHLVRARPLDVGAEVVEQLDHRLDVADARHVRRASTGSSVSSARGEDRQRAVLVPRGADAAVERAAALDHERLGHGPGERRGSSDSGGIASSPVERRPANRPGRR